MNNVVAYTSTLFTRKIKKYITPDYCAAAGFGVQTKPKPLTRKLMNKAITILEETKNGNQADLSIYTEHL